MRIKERIVTSQTSSDLGEVPEGIGDIDIIRATGMVGSKSPLGVALWRLRYGGDMRELEPVQQMLIDLAMRRGWVFEELEAVHLVNRVMRHWFDDLCHTCHGRGFKVVPGTPMLSDDVCLDCSGQGRVPMTNATESSMALLEHMSRLEREVASGIMKRLSSSMEF